MPVEQMNSSKISIRFGLVVAYQSNERLTSVTPGPLFEFEGVVVAAAFKQAQLNFIFNFWNYK
jgi:hypothetical protein